MKKIIISFITLSSIGFNNISLAQENDLDTYKKVGESVIESYKNKDYRKFSKDFNKDLSEALKESKVKQVIDYFKSDLGEISKVGELIVLDSSTIVYPLTFAKGSLNLVLSFDKNKKLSGILFKEPSLLIQYPKITDKTTIDEIANAYIGHKENMGLAIGTIDSNGKINEYYYGRKAKNKSKPDSNTLFEIGSITKVFTTTTFAKMALDKKVNLTDDIDKYTKSPNFENTKIKLQDLATHTSGLPRLPENLNLDKVDPLNPYSEYTRDEMYKALGDYKLSKKPNTVYEYSNFAMGILGDILATKEKKDYETLIKDEILKPLNMNNTSINLSRTQIFNMATPHDEKGEPVSMWTFKTLEGAGAIKSNIPDMLKFLKSNIYLDNSTLKNSMELAQETKFKSNVVEVGLGWHKNKLKSDYLIWHNGGTGGFRSFLGFLKNKKVGVIVLSNSGNGVDDLSHLILERLSLDK
ncbi:MAG: serine hydrolase [Candidatus Sericytochromatia bacterium]